MSDKLEITNGSVVLTTEEGHRVERPDVDLVQMMADELVPPLGEVALPDGLKFFKWRRPFLAVVHQLPPHVRQLRWIDNDSPKMFGPGTKYRSVEISIPYSVVIATFNQRGNNLSLTSHNELYFRNEPLHTLSDKLGFPALLNISKIDAPGRTRSWICTQKLRTNRAAAWTQQLSDLLDHTWNGAFNLSSEHHEGASWYGESQGIHDQLHPIEAWEQASKADKAFALKVCWKPASATIGELMDAMIAECAGEKPSAAAKPLSIVQRFLNFSHHCIKKKS